jgi:hypothetical protein
MNEILEGIRGLNLGEIEFYKNMAVAPLIGQSSSLDYIVLEEALKYGLSINETGSVPFLRFTNKSGKEVLILQGEYVNGGKQNRMVATNIYMAQGFDGNVPVRCIEHGRWSGSYSPSYGSSGRIASNSIRYAAAVGQQEVWDQVKCLSTAHNVHTTTDNLGEVYEQRKGNTGEYLSRFGYQSGKGIVSVMRINGKKIFSLDLFDKDSTMEKHFKKIVESYALDASVDAGNLEVSKQEIADFVENVKDASFNERKAVSLGRDYSISGKEIEGFALSYNDIALYTTFTNKKMNKPFVNMPLPYPEPYPIPESPPWPHPEPWHPHFPPWSPHNPPFGPMIRINGSDIIIGDSGGDWKEKFK